MVCRFVWHSEELEVSHRTRHEKILGDFEEYHSPSSGFTEKNLGWFGTCVLLALKT